MKTSLTLAIFALIINLSFASFLEIPHQNKPKRRCYFAEIPCVDVCCLELSQKCCNKDLPDGHIEGYCVGENDSC